MLPLLRPLAPNFFVKEPIPPITDPGLIAAIAAVHRAPTGADALQKAVDILKAKFQAKRFETYLLYPRIFETDPSKLWKRTGFMHCPQQNYLLRILMVNSGKLRDEDIELGYSFVWYISPHQFLKIHLPDKTIAVDPWNYEMGATIGKYAAGFGLKTL